MVYFPTLVCVVIVKYFGELLYAVAAECGICFPTEPAGQCKACHYFYSCTVTVGDICCQRLANLVEFASEYQLVLVVHVIKVCTGLEKAAAECIAQFIVCQAFGCGALVQFAVGVVVACWLFVCHAHRCKEAVVPVNLP